MNFSYFLAVFFILLFMYFFNILFYFFSDRSDHVDYFYIFVENPVSSLILSIIGCFSVIFLLTEINCSINF